MKKFPKNYKNYYEIVKRRKHEKSSIVFPMYDNLSGFLDFVTFVLKPLFQRLHG